MRNCFHKSRYSSSYTRGCIICRRILRQIRRHNILAEASKHPLQMRYIWWEMSTNNALAFWVKEVRSCNVGNVVSGVCRISSGFYKLLNKPCHPPSSVGCEHLCKKPPKDIWTQNKGAKAREPWSLLVMYTRMILAWLGTGILTKYSSTAQVLRVLAEYSNQTWMT